MRKHRVLIADDQALIREGLRTILEMEDDITVVGTASNGLEAYEMCRRLRPDLVMMDIRMPVLDGLDSIKLIRKSCPDTLILILSTFTEDDYIVEGLANGAVGYLLKDMDGERMLGCIRDALAGQLIMPSAVAVKLAARLARLQAAVAGESASAVSDEAYPAIALTDREREIAVLMLKGESNRRIAAVLYIGEGTVRNYVSVIYGKLGVGDRAQAIVRLRNLL